MSDYTKLTSFDTKDALSAGDPLKRVKGTELDDEFDAIATAVATKANSASPSFTGTPTAPTATAGTSTTQLATTAFVAAAMQVLYPVGSIYSSTVSTNPNTLFGFGTWVAFAAGRVMIGNGGGFSAGATGGSADAIVVSHTHSVNDPSHTHGIPEGSRFGGGTGLNSGDDETSTVNNYSTSQAASTGISIASAGSSGTNANLPPYIVVYMWNRTA
jgi:hypothetical protein